MSRRYLFLLISTMACSTQGSPEASSDSATVDDAATPPDVVFAGKLIQWLDANDSATVQTDGGAVTVWLDKSGVGNHVRSVGGGVALEMNAINGHAALRVGSQNGLFIGKNVNPDLGAFCVVAVVARYTNPNDQTAIIYRETTSSQAGVYLLGNSPTASFAFAGLGPPPAGASSATQGWNDGKFHTFGLRSVGMKMVALRVDGQEITAATGSGPGLGELRIGGDFSVLDSGSLVLSSSLEGTIAEVIVANNTAGTPTEIANLSAYFQKKYGIPF